MLGANLSVGCATAEDLEAVVRIDGSVPGGRRGGLLADALLAGHLWLARDGEEAVVGFAIFRPSFFGQWFIELLVVRPEDRRRGVATALVRRCEVECPVGKMFTSTNESNAPMRRLMSGLGYTSGAVT